MNGKKYILGLLGLIIFIFAISGAKALAVDISELQRTIVYSSSITTNQLNQDVFTGDVFCPTGYQVVSCVRKGTNGRIVADKNSNNIPQLNLHMDPGQNKCYLGYYATTPVAVGQVGAVCIKSEGLQRFIPYSSSSITTSTLNQDVFTGDVFCPSGYKVIDCVRKGTNGRIVADKNSNNFPQLNLHMDPGQNKCYLGYYATTPVAVGQVGAVCIKSEGLQRSIPFSCLSITTNIFNQDVFTGDVFCPSGYKVIDCVRKGTNGRIVADKNSNNIPQLNLHMDPNQNRCYLGYYVTSPIKIGRVGAVCVKSKSLPPPPPPPAEPTCSMTADPGFIIQGDSSTLSWSSTNTTSAFIDNSIGSILPNGSISISPNTTTIYTGTFTGSGGSITCSVTIAVSLPPLPNEPTCSMSADPNSIMVSDSSTLSWSSTNTTSVFIDNDIGNVACAGSVIVSPVATTTYTGTFTGDGGVTTCQVTVAVASSTPPSQIPTCSMNVSPNTINKGNKATLSWSSTNVDSVVIDNGIGNVSLNGSVSIAPDDATTYTGTFTGDEGAITCSASISVVPDDGGGGDGGSGGGGAGGSNPPTVNLASVFFSQEPDPIFIYLSQIPYTGFLNNIIRIFFMAN